MNNTASLQAIIRSMIEDAPPGSAAPIQKDIKTILNNEDSRKVIAEDLKQYHLNKNYKLVKLTDKDFGIISKYNKSGLKYYDPLLRLKFDYDFDQLKVIDIEEGGVQENTEIDALNERICDYALQHFPTFYKGMAIQDEQDPNTVYVLIVDENLNDANFYNGRWQSFYKLDKCKGELTGEITVKVHYYEDGNVALNTGKRIHETNISVDNVVETIATLEDKFEVALLKNFVSLNEDQFKNLRRQLPINRSKVQWGKSIRTYKLGQDAAEGKK